MKRLMALFVMGFAFASVLAVAADEAAKKPAAPQGAATAKSLDPAKGRFHQVHIKKLQLNCTNCHSSEQKDILFLRKDEPLPGGMPGQVDRQFCASCHTQPSKPTWYGASSR